MALFPGRSRLGGVAPSAPERKPEEAAPRPVAPRPAAPRPVAPEAPPHPDGAASHGVASNGAAATGASANGSAAGAATGGTAGDGATGEAAAPAGGFQAAELTMPVDEEDTDFDEELLRLSHKIHSVLVDELGGQQFKSDDRERLKPVAQQVMNDVLKDEKPLIA